MLYLCNKTMESHHGMGIFVDFQDSSLLAFVKFFITSIWSPKPRTYLALIVAAET